MENKWLVKVIKPTGCLDCIFFDIEDDLSHYIRFCHCRLDKFKDDFADKFNLQEIHKDCKIFL